AFARDPKVRMIGSIRIVEVIEVNVVGAQGDEIGHLVPVGDHGEYARVGSREQSRREGERIDGIIRGRNNAVFQSLDNEPEPPRRAKAFSTRRTVIRGGQAFPKFSPESEHPTTP